MLIKANGITLDYDERGPKDGPALVLIRGLGTQRIHWPDALIDGFADLGYRTITFDNRDIGLSQRCPAPGVSGRAEDILSSIARGETPASAYSLDDMALDVVGLLDNLGLERVHVFGISMGGGITQILTIDHGDRLHSATIVMTAARFPGTAHLDRLLARPMDRVAFQDGYVAEFQAWGSPGFPVSADDLRAEAGQAWDRGADPEGVNRQTLALVHSGDRRVALRAVDLPCLVIHGADDTLVPADAGREIASLIPGAQLQVIEGMGHVITPLLSPLIVEMVDGFIRQTGR